MTREILFWGLSLGEWRWVMTLVASTALVVIGAFWFGRLSIKPDDLQTVAYWQRRAEYWMRRAIRAEDDGAVSLNPSGAERFICDLAGAPSTKEDVQRTRAWRERRALGGDHWRRHQVHDAATDSEAATEIMQFCIGGYETLEGE